MSVWTGTNRRCRARLKGTQTVVGQRFAGIGPNCLSYYYYYYYYYYYCLIHSIVSSIPRYLQLSGTINFLILLIPLCFCVISQRMARVPDRGAWWALISQQGRCRGVASVAVLGMQTIIHRLKELFYPEQRYNSWSLKNLVLHSITNISFVQTVVCKMYRLGGETDSAIRWRKRTGVMSVRGTEEAGC